MAQRLIDADAILKKQHTAMEKLYGNAANDLREHLDIDDDLSIPIHAMESYSRAKQFYYGLQGILDAAPTVDAVPIVRCQDCKYGTLPGAFAQRYGEPGTLTCTNRGTPCSRRLVAGNDFCSYGVRKEDEL